MQSQKYNFKNLAFEGGGVKGIAYGGALRVLEKKGILKNIGKVAGTSAGAITSTLLALNFSPKEILEILKETNFNEFKDESPLIIPNIIRIFKDFGWFKGKAFKLWLQKTISKKADKNITFKELYNLKKQNKNNIRELYIVGANINKQIPEIFSYEKTPNMKIVDAVRISMSIPIVFAAVKKEGNVFADGGIYYNYPINLFDRQGYNKETLGLRVDTKTEIIEMQKRIIKRKKISSLKEYSQTIIDSLIDIVNKMHLSTKDWHRTIYINVGNIKATQFDLSEKQKADLIKRGEKYTEDYLKWFDNPPKNETPLNK
ncbi:patatin-like phospholipase family protein [Candidatus Pacearchaeota archaeon]|nr:patatin-like phospholipase family protein [Candidatus Pacearchaeota archaeon]